MNTDASYKMFNFVTATTQNQIFIQNNKEKNETTLNGEDPGGFGGC